MIPIVIHKKECEPGEKCCSHKAHAGCESIAEKRYLKPLLIGETHSRQQRANNGYGGVSNPQAQIVEVLLHIDSLFPDFNRGLYITLLLWHLAAQIGNS